MRGWIAKTVWIVLITTCHIFLKNRRWKLSNHDLRINYSRLTLQFIEFNWNPYARVFRSGLILNSEIREHTCLWVKDYGLLRLCIMCALIFRSNCLISCILVWLVKCTVIWRHRISFLLKIFEFMILFYLSRIILRNAFVYLRLMNQLVSDAIYALFWLVFTSVSSFWCG